MSDLVPEGWEMDVLPKFIEINPKLNQAATLSDDLKVSFIKMEDVSNNAVVVNTRNRKYSEVAKGFTKFNNHDVLVAKITPCFENGKGGYVDQLMNGIGFGSTEFHVMRAKKNFDSHYLYQYTNFPTFRLQAESSMCGTGGQRRVQTDFLRTHKIIVPPLPEQQKIASILTSVDEVIEKTQAQIDKLKDLKTGLMQSLLTPIENKGVGIDGIPHSEFKDSPVGRIPKGWEVVPLGSICDLQVGYAFKSAWFTDSGLKLLRGDNVGFGSPTWERIKYLSDEQSLQYLNYKLAEGDIVIGMDRTFTKSGVKITKLNLQDVPSLLVQRVGKFQPKSACNHKFLWQLLRSGSYLGALKNQEKGMDIPHLSKSEILEPLVAVPSLSEQQSIASVLNSLDDVIETKKRKLHSDKQLKKALMQDLLTGKVRVNVGVSSSPQASSLKAN